MGFKIINYGGKSSLPDAIGFADPCPRCLELVDSVEFNYGKPVTDYSWGDPVLLYTPRNSNTITFSPCNCTLPETSIDSYNIYRFDNSTSSGRKAHNAALLRKGTEVRRARADRTGGRDLRV